MKYFNKKSVLVSLLFAVLAGFTTISFANSNVQLKIHNHLLYADQRDSYYSLENTTGWHTSVTNTPPPINVNNAEIRGNQTVQVFTGSNVNSTYQATYRFRGTQREQYVGAECTFEASVTYQGNQPSLIFKAEPCTTPNGQPIAYNTVADPGNPNSFTVNVSLRY